MKIHNFNDTIFISVSISFFEILATDLEAGGRKNIF